MNDTDALVKELHEWAQLSHESGRHEGEADAFERAADRIETLTAENAALREALEQRIIERIKNERVDTPMTEETVADAIKMVKANTEPIQFQYRYRISLREGEHSKWSGWKNGKANSRVEGWEYETRGLYAL